MMSSRQSVPVKALTSWKALAQSHLVQTWEKHCEMLEGGRERPVSGEDTRPHLPWDGAASSLREGREETCYDTVILVVMRLTSSPWAVPLSRLHDRSDHTLAADRCNSRSPRTRVLCHWHCRYTWREARRERGGGNWNTHVVRHNHTPALGPSGRITGGCLRKILKSVRKETGGSPLARTDYIA